MIQFEKYKDEQEILKGINETIERKKIDLFLIQKVFDVCEKFNLKKINKRIETKLKEILPEYAIYLDKNYGMFNLIIWGNGIEYDRRFSALIGYDGNPYIDMEKVREYNIRHTLDEERIQELERGKIELSRMVEEWNEALQKLKALNTEAKKFELQYTFDVKGK